MNEFKTMVYLLERHIDSTTSQSEAPRCRLIRPVEAGKLRSPNYQCSRAVISFHPFRSRARAA
jgi:hypothetical protein